MKIVHIIDNSYGVLSKLVPFLIKYLNKIEVSNDSNNINILYKLILVRYLELLVNSIKKY